MHVKNMRSCFYLSYDMYLIVATDVITVSSGDFTSRAHFSASLLLGFSLSRKADKGPYLGGDRTPRPPALRRSTPRLCSRSVRHSTAGRGHRGASRHSRPGFRSSSTAFCHSRSRRCPWTPGRAAHLDSILHLPVQDSNHHCVSLKNTLWLTTPFYHNVLHVPTGREDYQKARRHIGVAKPP